MAEDVPLPTDESASADADGVEFIVARWLTKLTPSLTETVRCAALPHGFDLTLLSALLDTNEDISNHLDQLERSGLAVSQSPGRYEFQPHARGVVLHLWQTEDSESYRRANARGAEFYRAHGPDSQNEQIEYVYHQLGADDELGIKALSDSFDWAWETRQLGFAERLLRYAMEQAPVIESGSRAWLRYFQARLELARNRYTQSEEILRPLIGESTDIPLQALALMSFGHLLVGTQRWPEALQRYSEALDLFIELNDGLNAARLYVARGMAYAQLATSLGGMPERKAVVESRARTWWRRCRHAPFLLYRWGSRRIPYLPNLYFGTDYQDWFIVRLLYGAIDQFQEAAQQLSSHSQGDTSQATDLLTHVEISLADMYYRVGRWTLAERQFQRLEGRHAVKSDYAHATLQLVHGRVSLDRSQVDTAREYLQAACGTFAQYADRQSLATVTRLLGDTEVRAGDPDAAVPFYIDSIGAASSANDLLAATDTWSTLMTLRDRAIVSNENQARIGDLSREMAHRAYVARFPGRLLHRFRKLAAYVVAPITYVIIYVLAENLFLLVLALELGYQGVVGNTSLYLADLLFTISLLIAAPLLTLWVYELLYIFVGWQLMRRVPFRELVQHQPLYVVSVPERIMMRDEDGGQRELEWSQIERYVTIDRSLWSTAIPLVSRSALISETSTFIFDGILSHYSRFQQDINDRLNRRKPHVVWQRLDYSFFGDRWMLAALILVGLIGALHIRLGGTVHVSGENGDLGLLLPFSSAAGALITWGLYVFPVIGLARLLHNRYHIRDIPELHPIMERAWPLWIALALLLAAASFEVWNAL